MRLQNRLNLSLEMVYVENTTKLAYLIKGVSERRLYLLAICSLCYCKPSPRIVGKYVLLPDGEVWSVTGPDKNASTDASGRKVSFQGMD